jgi:hypothetical protein
MEAAVGLNAEVHLRLPADGAPLPVMERGEGPMQALKSRPTTS